MAKILLIEDERSIRQAIRFELEDEGHDVFYTSDWTEAFSAIRAFRFDLIISDIYFGKKCNPQLIEMMRKLNQSVPFIAMTAYPESELSMKIQAQLKDRFFAKPFITSVFKQKVSEIIQNSTFSVDATGQIHYYRTN